MSSSHNTRGRMTNGDELQYPMYTYIQHNTYIQRAVHTHTHTHKHNVTCRYLLDIDLSVSSGEKKKI